MSGSFLAQIIQSSITLAQHPAKQIATTSIELVSKLHTLTTLQDHSAFYRRSYDSASQFQQDSYLPGYITWRNYYPGVFSGECLCCAVVKAKSTGV